MEVASNILYGVISGLIAAMLFELLRANSRWFPGPSDPPDNIPVEQHDLNDKRSQNRQKLNLTLFNLFFYFYTFFVIYVVILLPPMLKSSFSKTPLLLNEARIIGDYLPQIPISSNFVQIWVVVIAVAIYIPLLLIVDTLAGPIANIVDNFNIVTIYRWRAIQGLLFVAFAAALAILSIYVFNNGTLKDAAYTLFGFVALAFIFGQANKR